MNAQTSLAAHPMLLLLCAAAGTLLGVTVPASATPAVWVIHISAALLNLVCLPLLVVTTVSGLTHLMGLPARLRRLLMIVLASSALMLLCAQAGVLAAQWGQIGWQLDVASQLELGGLVAANNAGDWLVMDLPPLQTVDAARNWAWPDNVFFALSSGKLAPIMLCTVVFGMAFTAQRGPFAESTKTMLEAASRALEKMIGMVNTALPLMVMACATQLASQWNANLVQAMSGFLICFLCLTAVLCLGMVAVVCQLGRASLNQVQQALTVPALLSLVAGSPLAAVPSGIEAMSSRLGFSRGIVEMLMPLSAVFLRTGAAIQFAMLAVYVAHLYGQQITLLDMLMLAPMAVAAALASAGSSGIASLGFAALAVAQLKLPFEAAIPLFIAINLLTEGPARLVSFLSSCALTAFVCGGLPLKKDTQISQTGQRSPVRLALSRRATATAVACVLLTSLLSAVLGLGLGLRQASRVPSPERPPSFNQPPLPTPNL